MSKNKGPLIESRLLPVTKARGSGTGGRGKGGGSVFARHYHQRKLEFSNFLIKSLLEIIRLRILCRRFFFERGKHVFLVDWNVITSSK